MTPGVLALQPGWLDLGVNLRRGQTGVAEQLLDRPQVRPALEQMGREGVAEGVGRDPAGDRRLAHPALEAAADVGGMETPAALGDEQRLLSIRPDERGAVTLEVAAESSLRGFSDRDEARLSALALESGLHVDGCKHHTDNLDQYNT